MGDGVVGHVNGRIGQRFDQVLFIPREFGSQSEGSTAAPLFKPIQSICVAVTQITIEFGKLRRLHIRLKKLSVFDNSVIYVPLIAKSNHTDILSSRNALRLGFVVKKA